MLAHALIGWFFMKKKWMVHRDGSCWRHCWRNFLPAKVFLTIFFRVKLKFRCYWWLVVNQHWRKGLDVFGDLENVSEMVAETSESSKDHQSESATNENNTCTCTCVTSVNNTCTCTCRICNLWSLQKKRLFSVKNGLLCYTSNGQCLACVHPIGHIRILGIGLELACKGGSCGGISL